MKCKKCGSKIKHGVVKNKKYGLICISCHNKLASKKVKS